MERRKRREKRREKEGKNGGKKQFCDPSDRERCEKCVFLESLGQKKVKRPQNECSFCYGMEHRDKHHYHSKHYPR